MRWVYVKDVPNVQLRHIRLENNENKPVTNSRDTQEVPHPKGVQVLRLIHSYRHSTSIFDDFVHYEKRQEEEDNRKQPDSNSGKDIRHEERGRGDHKGDHRNEHRGGGRNQDRERDREDNRDRDSGHRGGNGNHRNNDHHGGHHKVR